MSTRLGRRAVTGCGAVGMALLLACGTAAQQSDAARHSGTRGQELAAAIAPRVGAGKSTGIVVGTIDADGGVSTAAYGDPGPGAPPLDADSVFEIGSITKVFTAILLAEMVERGEVAFDDPIAKYLPAGVKVPERNGRAITLLDLATQSSGLPRLPDNLRPRDMSNPYADYSVEQLYDFLGRHQLARDIGASYEYSNLGVGLLGHVLALRAGTSYEATLRERVLDPLGMKNTAIVLTPSMAGRLAKGHGPGGRPVPNWDVPTLAGAGALRSTLNDMLTFARANLGAAPARLKPAIERTHAGRIATGRANLSVGLAWHILRVNDRDVIWHNGGTGGYRTWMGFEKSRRIAAVILTNSTPPADDLGYELLK